MLAPLNESAAPKSSAKAGAALFLRLSKPEDQNYEGQMQEEKKEPWMRLCEQASTEQDSQKLVALAQEIARLLEEKLAPAVADGQNRVSSLSST